MSDTEIRTADPVYVIGHKNPDTDAVCSALAYADLLQQTSRPTAVAACCGIPNLRTEFVLEAAGVHAPRILLDVNPTALQLCERHVVTAAESDTFFTAYQKMKTRGIRSIPVRDKDGRLEGLLPLLDLLNLVFEGEDTLARARNVNTTLNNIRRVLGGSYQQGTDESAIEDLVVTVGAMSATGFTAHIATIDPDSLLVVAGDRPSIQLLAIEFGVRALIVTGGFELSEGLVMIAKEKGVVVIKSPHDTATTTMLIKSARLIGPAIDRSCVTLDAQQSFDEICKIVEAHPQDLYPVVATGRQLVGVLTKTDLVNPARTKIILVDHNEFSQAVKGAEDADILEVLDHHRLGGGLRSRTPIRFINEVVGSTCTIVAMQYRMRGVDPSKSMAICMIAGLMSDTLSMTSPTTTDTDRDILEWLTPFSELDPVAFANNFFSAGSSLRAHPANEVIRVDCKDFEEQGYRFSVSQIEEIGMDRFWDRRTELLEALREMRTQQGYDFCCLLITDISCSNSLCMLAADKEFIRGLPFPKRGESLFGLDGVVSRKKQFLPMLTGLLGDLPKKP